MTHVGAVGKIIGSVLTGKKLEQPGRFVGGAAGGIKLHLVWFKPTQNLADAFEGILPLNGAEGVTCPVIAQGMGQAPVSFQLKVRFCQ